MGIEFRILAFLQGIRTPVGDAAMYFITKLGNKGIIWIVLAVILLLIPKKRKTGIVIMAALCIDLVVCNGILKNLFARIRPYEVNTRIQLLIARPDDFSFPSGHTASSFAAVAALYFCEQRAKRKRLRFHLATAARVKCLADEAFDISGERKLWKPALVLACLIAFSRLYLYVHYPTDILGGIFVGIAAGYIGYAMIWKLPKWKRTL